MSTDNSKVLKNEKNDRSLFSLNSTNRTTRNMGQIGVTGCQFAMPKDTIKMYSGVNIEMKPTSSRIASQINYDRMNVAVPFRSIWHYWDEYIGKGPDILRNGGFSVPYVQKYENESILSLPTMNSGRLFGYLLASLGGVRNRQLFSVDPSFTPSPANYNERLGNSQEYSYDYLDTEGGLATRSLCYDTSSGQIYTLPWWLPKLIKQGYSSSGINYQYIASTSSHVFHFRDISFLNLFNHLRDTPFVSISAKFNYESSSHRLYCLVAPCVNEEGFYKDMFACDADHYTFYVNCYSTSSIRYGSIVLGSSSSYAESDLAGRLYQHASSAEQCKAENICLTAALFNCLFNRPDMIGYGSLCEQLGVHFFKEYSSYEFDQIYRVVYRLSFASSGFFGDSQTIAYLSQYGRKRTTVTLPLQVFTDEIMGGSEVSPNINLLPFFAYQKICTDRFLLGHNILTNSLGQNSNVDTDIRYDSPYFRNNMIPTKCYYRPNKGSSASYDVQCMYVDDTSTVANAKLHIVGNGSAATTQDPSFWHFAIHINLLCSVFFSRNVMRQMDVFLKIWQRQDMNVQNILNASSYGVVDNNQKLQAKSMILAKSLAKLVRFGGQDMLADKVIENHFGVNDVPCDHCDVIILNSKSSSLKTEDIINTGGAVSSSATGEEGNPLPLGDKVSLVANSYPIEYDFECFIPDFSLILSIDWFSVPNYRTNVPNYATNELGWRTNLIEDFKLAYFPEYQASGDEPLYLDDVEFGNTSSTPTMIGWTNKNNLLKDSDINELNGEYQSKYLNQIVAADPDWISPTYGPSLTYGYLQPVNYTLPIVDVFGQHFLCGYSKTIYKKSCLTKLNEVGL